MTWLQAMGINEDTASFGHMRRFLDTIGVAEPEDLEALATSFEDIVHMIGSEHNPIALMKLRNALWRSTSLPLDMKHEVTIVDMITMMRRPSAPPGLQSSSSSPPPPPPDYHQAANARQIDEAIRRQSIQPKLIQPKNRRRSDFYHAEDLIYNTSTRAHPRIHVGHEGEHTSWRVLPPLTSAKDENYRTEIWKKISLILTQRI